MPEICHIINLEGTGVYNTPSFAFDVLEGLSESPKSLPSKYLYDEKGSWLFTQIVEQPEYYPTNCELEILERRKHDICKLTKNAPFRLVELGVGDARKTKVLLKHFLEQGLEFEYVLVDCCHEMIQQVVDSLKTEYKNFPLYIVGLVADYSTALAWISRENSLKNIVLFLGSSIGNFNHAQTHHFLLEMWNALKDEDSVFIGFDLKKSISILEPAYNDLKGVTREFNLNLLDRMNRELEAHFDRQKFMHHSFYNPSEGRMESWIISTKPQRVAIDKLQKAFDFEAWEGIHVENSYKYSIGEIDKLAEAVGFTVDKDLIDSKGYFADAVWQVKKMPLSAMEKKR